MKLYNFAVPIAVLTIAGIVHAIHSQLTPKPLRPFVVTSVMRAVRADGSWVEIWTRSINGRDSYERKINDYEAGAYTIVEDQTKSIVRSTIPETEYRHRLTAAISCQGHPSGKILGLDVNEFEDTYQLNDNPQGAATVVVKDWLAPDLGCFVLQKQTIWTRNSDGVLLVDTKITPIAITFQAVDQYFEIPTSYTERTREQARDLLEQAISK
jgi:hypothetical protein